MHGLLDHMARSHDLIINTVILSATITIIHHTLYCMLLYTLHTIEHVIFMGINFHGGCDVCTRVMKNTEVHTPRLLTISGAEEVVVFYMAL